MPRTITISDAVWDAIAARGKFGETEEDVLRRVLNLPANNPQSPTTSHLPLSPASRHKGSRSPNKATDKMSSYVANGVLHVSFQSGPSNTWKLPALEDKNGIRAVRDQAVEFADQHQASNGQLHAVRKALTEAGYHVTK